MKNSKPKGIIIAVVKDLNMLNKSIIRLRRDFDIGDTLYIIGWNCLRAMGISPTKEGLIAPFSGANVNTNINNVARKLGFKRVIVVDNETEDRKVIFSELIIEEGTTILHPAIELDDITHRVIDEYIETRVIRSPFVLK